MNAIEVRGLTKSYGSRQAVAGLNMTVPRGAIYGFIGENGSGKSTTEKMICGLAHQDSGTIRLFGRSNEDAQARAGIGVLIEAPGGFPNMSVWDNMMLQAANLGIDPAEEEVRRVLRIVRMEGAASNRFRNCSLGMRQRIGIALALLGRPQLLVLDEPINGLDADGMRIMREVLTGLSRRGVTILVSSHILGELEKVATHYGIIRHGRMVAEMSARELEGSCRRYTAVRTDDMPATRNLLTSRGGLRQVEEGKDGFLRVYDGVASDALIGYLYHNGILVSEAYTSKVSLERYYTDLMAGTGGRI